MRKYFDGSGLAASIPLDLMTINAERDLVAPRILEHLRPGKPISEGRKLFFDRRQDYYEARGGMQTESPPVNNCSRWAWKGLPKK